MFVFHRSETYYEIRGHIPIFKKIGDHFQIDKIWIIDSTCKIILKVLLISKYEMLKAYYLFSRFRRPSELIYSQVLFRLIQRIQSIIIAYIVRTILKSARSKSVTSSHPLFISW